jgi:hypothetical protein
VSSTQVSSLGTPCAAPAGVVHAALPCFAASITPARLALILAMFLAPILITAVIRPADALYIFVFAAFLLGTGFTSFWLGERSKFVNRFRHRAESEAVASAARVGETVHRAWIPSSPDAADIVRELESRRPLFARSAVTWNWDEFRQATAARGMQAPRTIVDSALAERLGAIEWTEYALEPEPILSSTPQGRATIAGLTAFCALIALLQVAGGRVWLGLFMLAPAACLVAGLPRVRDALRPLRQDEFNMIAGMGSLADRHGLRWSVDDAVMLVQTNRTPGGLYVSVVGEAGRAAMTFTDEHDGDFITLWQRWNHPHPRPELLPAAGN